MKKPISNDASPVALVTGGAKRIGRVICEMLHQEGYHVIIHYCHSQEEAEQLKTAFNQKRVNSASLAQFNLSSLDDLSKYVELIEKSYDRLNLLVNNASSFFPTPFGQASDDEWNNLMGSNLKGPFFLSQKLYPLLKKGHGAIVNITDIHGEKPLKGHCIYSIAKAGLEMMTYALAKELAPLVRVNGVAPGAIMWPVGPNDLDDVQKQKIMAKTLLKCSGSPKDIAQAVLYLTGAAYVTGEIIRVDGGRHLS